MMSIKPIYTPAILYILIHAKCKTTPDSEPDKRSFYSRQSVWLEQI